MQKYQYDTGLDDDLSHESSKEFLEDHVPSELSGYFVVHYLDIEIHLCCMMRRRVYLFLDFEEIVKSPSLVDIERVPDHPIKPRKVSYGKSDAPLFRTQAWVEEDVNVMRYPDQSAHGISSGDTDHSVSNIARFKNKKSHRKHKVTAEEREANLDVKRRKKSASKTSYDKHKSKNVEKCKNKDKASKTKSLIKKVVKKKSSYNILIKCCSKKVSSADFGNFAVRSKRNLKQNALEPSASKPVIIFFYKSLFVGRNFGLFERYCLFLRFQRF